jgi:hypothetical protein
MCSDTKRFQPLNPIKAKDWVWWHEKCEDIHLVKTNKTLQLKPARMTESLWLLTLRMTNNIETSNIIAEKAINDSIQRNSQFHTVAILKENKTHKFEPISIS